MKLSKKSLAILSISLGLAANISSAGNDKRFTASFELVHGLTIEEVQHLDFGNVALNGTYQQIIVDPEDTGAAVFNAKGIPYARVQAYVRNGSGVMYRIGSNSRREEDLVRFSDFRFGGGMGRNAYTGDATFDPNGEINNIRIGASAYIQSYNNNGSYKGSVSLVMYYL